MIQRLMDSLEILWKAKVFSYLLISSQALYYFSPGNGQIIIDGL